MKLDVVASNLETNTDLSSLICLVTLRNDCTNMVVLTTKMSLESWVKPESQSTLTLGCSSECPVEVTQV